MSEVIENTIDQVVVTTESPPPAEARTETWNPDVKRVLIVAAQNPSLPEGIKSTGELVSQRLKDKGFTGECVVVDTSDSAIDILNNSLPGNKFDLIVLDGVLKHRSLASLRKEAKENSYDKDKISGIIATAEDSTLPILKWLEERKQDFSDTRFISITPEHTPSVVRVRNVNTPNNGKTYLSINILEVVERKLKTVSKSVARSPKSESHWYDTGLDQCLKRLDVLQAS